MNLDPGIFLNYGIAGLILLVFYLLFKNELHSLKESIEALKSVVAGFKACLEKHNTLLEIVLEEIKDLRAKKNMG